MLPPADWANPISYIQQAIAINEFNAPRWKNVPAPGYANAGEAILRQRGVHTDDWWIWLVRLGSIFAPPHPVAGYSKMHCSAKRLPTGWCTKVAVPVVSAWCAVRLDGLVCADEG